jgi:hypothetical protein
MSTAMKKILCLLLPPLATALLLTACEVGSADDVVRSVGINVAGVYRGASTNSPLVSRNSGTSVTQLDVRQNGDMLEAIDNNNRVYRGTLGAVSGNSASFNMTGATTAGKAVTISGNFRIITDGGEIRGTWIEDDFSSTVYGVAAGPTINTNTPIQTNTNGSASISITLTPLEIRELLAATMQPQPARFYATI